MAIKRDYGSFDGEITFECDQCGEELCTEEADFHAALNKMKAEGWKSEKSGADWEHTCPGCQDTDIENDFDDEWDL